MAVFDKKSRYVRYAETYETQDARGRTVTAVGPAAPPARANLGDHLLKGHLRLDHLAAHYLSDPMGFWAIAAHNDAMLPDAALRRIFVRIPRTE